MFGLSGSRGCALAKIIMIKIWSKAQEDAYMLTPPGRSRFKKADYMDFRGAIDFGREDNPQMSRWDSPGPFIKSRRPLSGGSSRDEKLGSVSAVS